MSKEWKKFEEEEPKKGQFILVCSMDVKPDDLDSYPCSFQFQELFNDYFMVISGRRGRMDTYSTFRTVWRDMIKLPGEK